jgi:hypothetical protein
MSISPSEARPSGLSLSGPASTVTPTPATTARNTPVPSSMALKAPGGSAGLRLNIGTSQVRWTKPFSAEGVPRDLLRPPRYEAGGAELLRAALRVVNSA